LKLNGAYGIPFHHNVVNWYATNVHNHKKRYNCKSIIKYLQQEEISFQSFSNTFVHFDESIYTSDVVKSLLSGFIFKTSNVLLERPFILDIERFKEMRYVSPEFSQTMSKLMIRTGALSIKQCKEEPYRLEIPNEEVLIEFKNLSLYLPVSPSDEFKPIAAKFESIFDMVINRASEENVEKKVVAIEILMEGYLREGPQIISLHEGFFSPAYGFYGNEDFCRTFVKNIMRDVSKKKQNGQRRTS
jgi:hypothetical protein